MRRKQSRSNKDKWTDHLTLKAKKEGYPARSVYKLEEIQKKNQILKNGDRVLDLGCAPGSWLLYAARITGKTGHVTGIDMVPATIAPPSNATIITADLLSIDIAGLGLAFPYQVVLSDMAPSTTGIKKVDAARSLGLCEAALGIAEQALSPGGVFVCKIFQGDDFTAFSERVKLMFRKRKIFKPSACRKESREIYIIGLDKKAGG